MRFLALSASSRAGLAARAALVALAALHLTCNQAILTAPATASTLRLFANPEFIPANGGVSVISALLTEDNTGTPVADGTTVQFFTNLGRIQEQAKTNDGVARVNLIADSRSGTATVSAFSGALAAESTVEVRIGGGIPPARMILTANPVRLTDQRASRITATVLDTDGNPVPNVAVFFSISRIAIFIPSPAPSPTPLPPLLDEFMESRGSPVFTNNNGQAIDVMRTNRPFDGLQVRVTVAATVAVGSSRNLDEEVDVIVN
jgi:hypothetical protein